MAQSTPGSGLTFHQQTLRQIVHTSVGGSIARVHISNAFGAGPLTVEDVRIALSANNSNSSIVSSSEQLVTFQGSQVVTIPAGAEVASDATNFAVPALGDVAISMYFPGTTSVSTATTHLYTEETNFYASGDVSSQSSLPGAVAIGQYYFLTGLDVQGASLEGSFVTVGASITDGFASSYLQNHRWPNDLAQRFISAGMGIGVLNEGISGNQMLTDNGTFGVTPEHRFNRDVLTQPGVHWVILSDDPINDLGNNSQATASELIAAIQQLMNQAHQVQFKFLCSTLTPYKGASYWTSTGETKREQINSFIRSSSSGCDGVVDQDNAVHDPNNPQAYLPAYDSGDHLHPNDAGYQAIANAVNLALFTAPPQEAPFGGNPAGIPGTVQAENYDVGGQETGFYITSINGNGTSYRPDGVDLETTSAPGGGNDVAWTSSGQWFRYTVNVATAGTYNVTFEVASPTGVTDGLHLSNSAGTNLTGSVNIPNSGGWQTWTTVTASVTLPAGQQVLTWNQDNGGYNLYSMAFAATGSSCTTAPSAPTGLTATPASESEIDLSWTASTAPAGCSITYSVTRNGTQIASGVTGTSFRNTGLACGAASLYTVAAVDSFGSSGASNQASVATECPGPQINAGGPAVSPFAADTDFVGGATINHANTIDLSGVTNPAPMAVYQTARVAATVGAGTTFSYTIPGFAAGSSQLVRLHFAETFHTTAGSRVFNVSINGAQVLTNFDIFAAAGAANKAVVKEFTVAANASNQYMIVFTTVTDKALVSGIEVLPPTTPCSGAPITPTGLTAMRVSTSRVNLSWTASTAPSGCTVSYSVFRGTTSGFTPSSSTQIATGVAAPSFPDTNALCNTTPYFYVVEAVDSAGSSGASNEASPATACPPPTNIQIDSGGPAVAPFVADVDFTGGTTINHANTINLNGQTNPAPAAVYQTARVTATAGAGTTFSYTIPVFSPGSHTVRLHFCETFHTTAGSRVFNVSINGTQVLTNFDIFATAGGQNRALIEQFTATANASNQYVIVFTAVTDKALVSGIEID